MLSYSLYAVTGNAESTTNLPVVAFLSGMFPDEALIYLRDKTAVFARKGNQESDALPSEMIEGISMFHKARLSEVGIDNAQNLAAANLIELLVKTPFSPRQLIDWIGQAKLYVYFKSDIEKLRTHGIRTVFDLKNACEVEGRCSQIAEKTEISEVVLGIVFQQVKADLEVARLLRFLMLLSAVKE